VGTIFLKGISGGQKRRLSIAIELVSDPTLLLLGAQNSLDSWNHSRNALVFGVSTQSAQKDTEARAIY
jgi:ABC-type Mn2+/Zn2+ transport system ATPase subunit